MISEIQSSIPALQQQEMPIWDLENVLRLISEWIEVFLGFFLT